MASCCHDVNARFTAERIDRELERYRERGLLPASDIGVRYLTQAGVEGDTLLDVGGGMGGVSWALLDGGACSGVLIEEADAYIEVGRREGAARGFGERLTYRQGDFVELARELEAADLVVLDRVICCYDDLERMVHEATRLARRRLMIVYPRDAWWVRAIWTYGNLRFRLEKIGFRTYVHSNARVHTLLEGDGFRRVFDEVYGVWRTNVYERAQDAGAAPP